MQIELGSCRAENKASESVKIELCFVLQQHCFLPLQYFSKPKRRWADWRPSYSSMDCFVQEWPFLADSSWEEGSHSGCMIVRLDRNIHMAI